MIYLDILPAFKRIQLERPQISLSNWKTKNSED